MASGLPSEERGLSFFVLVVTCLMRSIKRSSPQASQGEASAIAGIAIERISLIHACAAWRRHRVPQAATGRNVLRLARRLR